MTARRNQRRGAADPLAAATDLLRRGIMPLPIKVDTKHPINTKWQGLTITTANVAQYFDGKDVNVGGRMGEKSGGLVDVDVDCAEALLLKEHFLPPTEAIYGRAGNRASHYLYRCDDLEAKGNHPFLGEGDEHLLDLKIGGDGKGSQSVMPGSRHHPSGEFYAWDRDGAPARIAYAAVKTAATNLAVASLLMRHWPEHGRNVRALGVGGFLARAGWSVDRIFKVVHTICLKRGAPERAEKHAQSAAGCVAKLENGTNTYGYPQLKETFGEGVAKVVATLVGYREHTVAEPVRTDNRPVVKLASGTLSTTADAAEKVLIDAGVMFYERSNSLVRPIIKTVDSFHGRKTETAQFARVDATYMRDVLGRVAGWHRLDQRGRQWVLVDPPHEVAATILARVGEWRFNTVIGIASTPTLRPDGTILDQLGYDPVTRLLLIDTQQMPPIPANPTKADAEAALALITDRLEEFKFVDDVSKSVAVAAIITPVARGAFTVAPMTVADAPVPGSGKSYLFDLIAIIATGQRMPVITASRNEEENEKRLGAAVMASQSLITLDNVNGVLRGDTLGQLIERQRPMVRVLGRSEMFEVEAGGVTFFANGNNIVIAGDLCRRVIRTRLDPQMERPELREFTGDPIGTVMQNRGAYIAAALTICRAYIVAGRPDKQKRLASFEGWSDTVRSAVAWLGLPDPCESMDDVRTDDPETTGLITLLEAWATTFGTGKSNSVVTRDVISKIDQVTSSGNAYAHNAAFTHPVLRDAVLGALNERQPTATSLGVWLRGRKDRRVNGMWFENEAHSHGTAWWVMKNARDEGEPGPPSM